VPDYQSSFGASLNNLGQDLADREHFADARALYEEAISHQKSAVDANPRLGQYQRFLRNHQRNLASVLVHLGDYKGAAQATEEFMRVSPNPGGDLEFVVKFLTACATLADGDAALATAERRMRSRGYRERCEKLVKNVVATVASANDPRALNGLAWFLATCPDSRFRDVRRAVEVARKAVEKAPKAGEVWNTLGVAEYRAGAWDEAIEALSRSVELTSGGSASDHFFLAMAHWKKGDKAKARSWYDKAVHWMEETKSQGDELPRFRDEAAALLGVTDRSTSTARKEKDAKQTSKP
jgi:tetratricopeptide (TPR) repeat protein